MVLSLSWCNTFAFVCVLVLPHESHPAPLPSFFKSVPFACPLVRHRFIHIRVLGETKVMPPSRGWTNKAYRWTSSASTIQCFLCLLRSLSSRYSCRCTAVLTFKDRVSTTINVDFFRCFHCLIGYPNYLPRNGSRHQTPMWTEGIEPSLSHQTFTNTYPLSIINRGGWDRLF